MTKSRYIAELVEKRIRYGDYALRGVPNDVQLAEELGVSRMTVRRAVQQLIDKSLLVRQPNGRIAVARTTASGTGQFTIGFLAPAYSSVTVDRWRTAAEQAAARVGATMRPVEYVHWDDPVISRSLDALDGCFLLPGAERIPETLLKRLASLTGRVAVLEHDLTDHGIPCATLIPADGISRLLDHVHGLGHRQIDCFNTQPWESVIDYRVGQWRQWCGERGVAGQLLNEPVPPYAEAAEQAYRFMSRLLVRGNIQATAIVCTTNAVFGLMRAAVDQGLVIGRDLSVCSMLDEGMGRYFSPSLTSIQMPDPLPYLLKLAEWMHGGGTGWTGPLLLRPETDTVFEGESTGPVPVRALEAV